VSGSWSCDTTGSLPIASGSIVTVSATDPSGNTSNSVLVPVTSSIPTPGSSNPPSVESTDGTSVSGEWVAGSIISIIDPAGPTVLCQTSVLPNGSYTCTPLSPTPSAGTNLEVTQTTGTGTASPAVQVTVENPATFVASPSVNPSAGSPISGTAEPGSIVTIYNSLWVVIGTWAVNGSGSFSIIPNPIPWNGDTLNVTSTLNGTTSNPSSTTINTVDTDGDGVNNTDEAVWNNSWDGNGNGIPDNQESSVTTKLSPITSTPVTMWVTGSSCQVINGYDIVTEWSQASQDGSFDYPIGIFDFELYCGSIWDTTEVTFYLDSVYDTSNWVWRKYNRTTNTYANFAGTTTFGTAIVGTGSVTTITVSLQDNNSDDEDITLNARILDPSGPAVVVPRSSWWGGGWSSKDKCPDGDTSASRYDNICEEPWNIVAVSADIETEDDSETPTWSTDLEEENPATIPDQNIENTIQKSIINLQWETVNYSLATSYDSCLKIPVILDTNNITLEGIFTDIDSSEYPQIVANFKQTGIINGYDDGRFDPVANISRTEFLKIVLKTHCLTYDSQQTDTLWFVDTNKNSWQARVISKSEELWIISGDTLEINRDLIDINLGKQYSLERIQELKRVLRWLGLYSGEVDGYYTEDLVEAVYNFQLANGLVTNEYQAWAGTWGPKTRETFFEKYPETSYRVFRPNDVISKSEALKILMKMSNISVDEPQLLLYSDIETSWHIPYVRSAQTLGLFDPESDDFEFRPSDGVQRDDMVKLIDALIRLYR